MVYSKMLRKNFRSSSTRRRGEAAVRNWRRNNRVPDKINKSRASPKIEDHGAVAGDWRYEHRGKMYKSRQKALRGDES